MAAAVAAGVLGTVTTVAWEAPATERPPAPRVHLPRRPPVLSEEIMEPEMPSGGVLAWAKALGLTLQSSLCVCVCARTHTLCACI